MLQPMSPAGEGDQTDAWKENCTQLLNEHGCASFKWQLSAKGRFVHCIFGAKEILRPVYLVPGFTRPLQIGLGTSHWR